MVSSHGIAHESYRFPPNKLQKLVRVENGKLTFIGLPPPLQELPIGPSKLQAILMLLNRVARLVRIIWAVGFWYPFAGKQVALFVVQNPRPHRPTIITSSVRLCFYTFLLRRRRFFMITGLLNNNRARLRF